MKFSTSNFTLGMVCAAVVTLTACGGGGGGATTGGTGATVTGIAATGLAIANGSVTLKCATGITAAQSTLTDGSYTIDVSGVTLPCVARVDYKDAAGASQKLHSLVSSAGNVNITPVTDMLVANLNNGTAADAYDNFDSEKVKGHTKERISTETANVKNQLIRLGVDTSKLSDDPIGTKFVATHGSTKGDDQDDVLDKLKDHLDSNHKDLEEVEHEMSSGQSSSKGFATSTGVKTNSATGQSLYAANCASCHGARIPDAMNYQSTLKAIAKNKGGMGYLSASIKTAQADDIATYLAYGAVAPVTPVLPAQNIAFTSPGNQTIGVATLALVATSDSNLAVTVASSTPTICTVTNTALTLMGAGSCTLTATQAGSTTVAAATPVSYTFAVAAAPVTVVVPTAQTITLTPPGNQTMGMTPAALVATTSATGLAVTLASTTPSVCTVNGTTLTLVAAGSCTVTASQAGSATVAAAATASSTFTVASATAAAATAGKVAYNLNTGSLSCASCHGLPGSQTSSRLLLAAATPSMIPNAITNNVGGMGSLANKYTTQQLSDMAAYLATPNI